VDAPDPLAEAARLLAERRRVEADALLASHLADHPDDLGAWRLRAEVLARQCLYIGPEFQPSLDEALAQLERLGPDDFDASLQLAVHLSQARPDSPQFRAARERAFAFPGARETGLAALVTARSLAVVEALATGAERERLFRERLVLLELATKRAPDNLWAWSSLIVAHSPHLYRDLPGAFEERWNLAVEAGRRAAAALPNEAQTWYLYGITIKLGGEGADLRREGALREGREADAAGERGLALDRFRAAIPPLDRAVALEPDYGSAYLERGYARFRGMLLRSDRADLPEVLVDAERACALDPRRSHPPFVLGIMHHSTDDRERALAAWDEAMARSPGDVRPLRRSLSLLAEEGNPAEARRLILRQIDHIAPGPERDEVLANLEVLEALLGPPGPPPAHGD
jgi:tetratricopeptide (TPR) repeat protein